MRVPNALLLLSSLSFMPAWQESAPVAESKHQEFVRLPRTWMRAKEILITASRQTGLKYSVVLPQFETPVGPFAPGSATATQELIDKIAEATGADAHWIGDVIVFDPDVETKFLESDPSSTAESRESVERIALVEHSATVPELSELAGFEDGSTRFHALAALVRLEGDFMRNSWPGRLSIYEVLYDQLDRDALLFAMEEGGPPGGRVWKMAAEILGRAREPSLTRGVWWNLWMNRPGTIRLTLWCMGRCGDPSGLGPLRERIWNIATNDITDQYLAAIVLGELDAVDLLADHLNQSNVDVRRAAALALGLCKSKESAAGVLEACLNDRDPVVQSLACHSLGRLGKTDCLKKLLEGKTAKALWTAALASLAEASDAKELLQTTLPATERDPVRLAEAARVWGELGGVEAGEILPRLLEHQDRWVRAAAAEGLARLGTPEGIDQVGALAQSEEEDADVRIAAVLGLGRSLSPEAAPALFAVAGNTEEHYRLRQYAVLGLARLAKGSGQERIEQLVDRDSTAFMAFAARHVRCGTPEKTATLLVPLLTHGDRDSACAAAGNLSELGYGPGVRELLEGSDIFDNHTRMMHAWGAIRSGEHEATAALIEAGKSRRRLIRQGAALSLGGRHTPGAVDTLLEFAADEEEGVRAAAAQSLGLSADPLAIPVLVRLAENDPSQAVRTEAIRALRSRDFAVDPEVKKAFDGLVGAEADAGVLDAKRPSVTDQKANTFVLRNWSEAYEEDLVSNLTYETTVCYDSHCERVIMWGAHGRRYDSPQTGQTWFFDAGTSTWTRLVGSSEWPNGTCCNRQMVFDSANKLAVVAKSGRGAAQGGHGWLNGLRGNLSFSIPWVLDVTKDEWIPMRPAENFGNLGMVGGTFDQLSGLTVWWRGELVAYDGYANQWLSLPTSGLQPEPEGNNSIVFDPSGRRLIAIGKRSTWAYDPYTLEWHDLAPGGEAAPSGAPMVYDSANDVMLALKQNGQDPMRVWVYHLRENRWEKLPPTYPAPRYGTMFDAAYDPRHNVVVVSGNESMSWSGALTARETWTYRYRPAVSDSKNSSVQSPLNVKVVTVSDGRAIITWKPPLAEGINGYLILRKVAQNAADGEWKQIAEVAADQLVYTDTGAPANQLVFYSVVTRRGDHEVSVPSLPVRAAARSLRYVSAVVTDQGVHVTWQPGEGEDLTGYTVYRSEVDLGWPWHDVFDPSRQIGDFERITVEPVTALEFFDREARLERSASELYWPKTWAYIVRAVNEWGIESGFSPVALALADAPGQVRVIPWLDGRRLVLWSPPRAGDDLRGYHVMRMDDWHRDYVFRWQAAPMVGTIFFDDDEFPQSDRRRYYISGVDVMGGVGIPSSGAWSHGLP